MATIDLPASPAFAGAAFSLGLDVTESGFQGFYTGNRQAQSTLSDRLTGLLTLPPCAAAAAADREALLMQLRSAGDWLRMGLPHRRVPRGTISGLPVVGAAAAAGARSLVIASAGSSANLLAFSSFDTDSNADGLADSWAPYAAGTTGAVARSTPSAAPFPVHGVRWQRVTASGLGAGAGDAAGVSQTITLPAGAAGRQACFSGYLYAGFPGHGARLQVDWFGAGSTYLASTLQQVTPTGAWQRFAVAGTVPAGAVQAACYVFANFGFGGFIELNVDAAQFELDAAAPGAYTPGATLLGGDVLGVGGNLLLVGPAGAQFNEAGTATVPLVLPLPKALASGAAVAYAGPTGVWEYAGQGIQFDYGPGIMQGPVVIPFRQVVV